jgi:hypothetical protein
VHGYGLLDSRREARCLRNREEVDGMTDLKLGAECESCDSILYSWLLGQLDPNGLASKIQEHKQSCRTVGVHVVVMA